MRMSRKRRRRLDRANVPVPEAPASFRMSRKRLRQRRESRRPSPAGTLSLSLLMLGGSLGEAASLSTLHEVPAELQALRDAREEIINYHEAQRNLKSAQENLAEAERALATARQDREEANEGLLRARLNLEAAKVNLEQVRNALAEARAESELRTQEALRAQQAVAEYLPNIYAQEAAVEQLSGEEAQLTADYAARYEAVSGQADVLAARIEQAWASVDWQQNRIAEVQAMLAGADTPESDSGEAAYESRLEEISSELDRENSYLDEMYAYLDQLQESQDRAEEAESEARELVADLTEQQEDAEAEVVQGQQDLEEAEKWQHETEQETLEAEKELALSEEALGKAEYELEHFDETSSSQSQLEYYSWHGPEHGHQLVLGQEFYNRTKKYDFGVNFGYVVSRSGHQEGHGNVTGMTDTQLTVTLKNDHPVNEVHYELGINVPTGKEAHVNAQLAEGLARYTSFNNGFVFTPAVEVRHRFSERESVAAKLSYAFRGEYQARYTNSEGLEAWEKISPGNQLMPEVSYLYAGEKDQYTIKAGYTHNGKTDQYSDSVSKKYREGDGFWVRWFYNHDITPADSWQAYAAYSREGGAFFFDDDEHSYNDALSWHEFGLGWRHKWKKGQYLQLMLNYQQAQGNLYRYSTRGLESEENYLFSPRRLSASLVYGQKLSDRENLEIRAERYVIKETGGNYNRKYNGWGLALMYNRSF